VIVIGIEVICWDIITEVCTIVVVSVWTLVDRIVVGTNIDEKIVVDDPRIVDIDIEVETSVLV
jgi:hypothetical protein